MVYTSKTTYKAYTCDVKGGFGTMVKSITGICNVRGEKLPFGDAPIGLLVGSIMRAPEHVCLQACTLQSCSAAAAAAQLNESRMCRQQ